jgi:hypothetical protein
VRLKATWDRSNAASTDARFGCSMSERIMRSRSSRVNGFGGTASCERDSDGHRISHAINALKSLG